MLARQYIYCRCTLLMRLNIGAGHGQAQYDRMSRLRVLRPAMDLAIRRQERRGEGVELQNLDSDSFHHHFRTYFHFVGRGARTRGNNQTGHHKSPVMVRVRNPSLKTHGYAHPHHKTVLGAFDVSLTLFASEWTKRGRIDWQSALFSLKRCDSPIDPACRRGYYPLFVGVRS